MKWSRGSSKPVSSARTSSEENSWRWVGSSLRAPVWAPGADPPLPGPADVAVEQSGALGPRKDDPQAPLEPVMCGVAFAQLLQAHSGRAYTEAGSTLRPVSTKPAVPTEPRPAPAEDIRSARPYLLSRNTLVAVGRRLASVAVLIAIDLVGLVLGVFVALVFRALYLGQWPPLWGILWV